MSIKKSEGLGQSSSQQQQQQQQQQQMDNDRQQQNDQVVMPMSQQQEQQHLQHYWHNNDEGSWTQDDEEKVLYSWASRTFSATCYKFTIQNDPTTRQQPSLYSFLENWQLHTMYNKSQKVLLGIADRRPCVLLTGDDFMFTPPPLTKDDNDDRLYQQARMEYLDEEDEDGDTNGGAAGTGIVDEHLWILYQPTTFSPLHVVNTDEDNDDDDEEDEQEIMVMGRDHHTRTIDPLKQQQRPLVSPALVKWYQTVEHPTTTSMIQQQRPPSTILMTTPHDDDTPTFTDGPTSTLVPEDTMTNSSSSTITAPEVVVVLTWRQWLQQGVVFLSQRMVEVAYLVAELAESLATTTTVKEEPCSSSSSHLLMTHTPYQVGGQLQSSSPNNNKATSGHYIVQLFRVWRVFFLGVETMMHRLFSLDASSHTIAVLPLVTKSPATF